MERFNHNKLTEVEVKEQYRIEISNRLAALENQTPRWVLTELGKLLEYQNFSQRDSCRDLKKHKPYFDEKDVQNY
jgi:hypothetical protein